MLRQLALGWLAFILCPLLLVAANYQLEELAATVRSFYGEKAELRVRAWRQLIADSGQLSETDKLSSVNDFFNQLQFVDDIEERGDGEKVFIIRAGVRRGFGHITVLSDYGT